MPNAAELSEAGVSFVKVGNIFMRSLDKVNDNDIKDSTSFFNLKFDDALMTIPCFRVIDDTETLMRNLIAYEQHSSDVNHRYFSDFAVFLGYRIKFSSHERNHCEQDRRGQRSGFFNKIEKGVAISDDFYCEEECRKAVEHCEQRWNRMKENYISSPSAKISTVVAIILLLLKLTQTVLSFVTL
ncbi:hypothetical protein H5410_003759 [Solanum commersonii]|uniref:Uncharacterized protein n=1 Tax=Solanum commersonii TaxID=4109 RepID=A0A9J6B608_SOLCO|nr:hypothetical protein H5410_003759 [Solanum commersonii]